MTDISRTEIDSSNLQMRSATVYVYYISVLIIIMCIFIYNSGEPERDCSYRKQRGAVRFSVFVVRID